MINNADDEFKFRRSSASRKTVDYPEPGGCVRLTEAVPRAAMYRPCTKKEKLMTERKEQIELLNAAKADVQKQLDIIFAEESDKLIDAMTHLSQVDPKSAAQFLAQTTYAHFNEQDETIRSGLIDSFSTAFGTMAEKRLQNGATGWDDEDMPMATQEEQQTSIDAA